MKALAWRKLDSLEFESTLCPVCKGDESRPKFRKTIRGRTMHYVLCQNCGALYANPRATEETLQRIYNSKEFFEGKEDNINYYSFLAGEDYLTRTAASRLRRIRKFARGRDLLEVASAAGFFLGQAKKSGFNARGVEVSEPMAQYAAERSGVPVTTGSIERIDLPANGFDVIASWGVFTILRDPNAVLAKFHRALRRGGVLALNTYYHDGLWCRIWESHWYILVLNTSQIFSREGLRKILHGNGFTIVSRRRDKPYASVKYLAFQLMSHFPGSVKNRIFDRIDFLNRFVVRVPAPDNYEYICRKR